MTDKKRFTGNCVGGPLHGKKKTVRYPRGFLYVDKNQGKVWIYDYHSDEVHVAGRAEPIGSLNNFLVREEDGRDWDEDKGWNAAQEPEYDVVAHDAEAQS